MKKIKPFILPTILLLTGFILLCLGMYLNREIYLLEYTKQIEQLGYYKEDIHLLDLYDKQNAAIIYTLCGAGTMVANVFWLIFEIANKKLKKEQKL